MESTVTGLIKCSQRNISGDTVSPVKMASPMSYADFIKYKTNMWIKIAQLQCWPSERLAGVTPEVTMRDQFYAITKLPEAQNRGYKKTDVLQRV